MPTILPRGMGSELWVDNPSQSVSKLNANSQPRRMSLADARHVAPDGAPASALDLEVQTCACPIALRFFSALRIPSTFRIGAVNIAVTKAMMTIMVKSVGVKAPTL